MELDQMVKVPTQVEVLGLVLPTNLIDRDQIHLINQVGVLGMVSEEELEASVETFVEEDNKSIMLSYFF